MNIQVDAVPEVVPPASASSNSSTGRSNSETRNGSRGTSPSTSSQSGNLSSASSSAPSNISGNEQLTQETVCGYPKKMFLREVEEMFLCCHCENALREPLQSTCGHRFCAGCRTKMTQLDQPVICQACIKDGNTEEESILNLSSMFADKAAIREMKKLACRCLNSGCDWKGNFQVYISEHENSCEKKVVTCRQCTSFIFQNKLAHHEGFECPKRQVTCPHCNQQMLHEHEMKHKLSCPDLPVKCGKCSITVPRQQFQTHQERDCTHREMVCPVPDCHKKMTKEKFPAHLNDSPKSTQKHLLYLFDRINQLEAELGQLNVAPPTSQANTTAQGAASASSPPQSPQQHGTNDAAGGSSNRADNSGAGGADASSERATATLKLHEDLMSVLHGEILRCIRQIESLTNSRQRELRSVQDLTTKLQTFERTLGTMEMRLRELHPTSSPINGHDAGYLAESNGDGAAGTATWCIPGFSQVRRAAINNTCHYVDSPSFTTGPIGYKLRLKIFPDGDGDAKGKSISVFVQLLPGKCDDLLTWPFQADIHFVLIDQKDFKHHKKASIRAPSSEVSCRKPSREPNPSQPNGQPGVGVHNLVSVQEMGEDITRYNQHDNLYLRVMVTPTSGLLHARLKSLDPRPAAGRTASTSSSSSGVSSTASR